MTNQTIAEAGAYFMAGAIDALAGESDYNFDALSGWCGFVTELCQYAEYSDALAYAGYGATGDYPGGYGYEVQEPFGRWFAVHYLESGVPTRDQCRIWLLNAAEKFFLCGDAPVEHLSRALMMVGEPK